MQIRSRGVVVLASVLALAVVTPSALASGKAAGGGATSTTISSTATTPNAGGGGSGGGGGGGGGGRNSGANDVVVPVAPTPPPPPPPTPATVTCAAITSASATVGYYSIYAALWNNFALRNCADGQETVYLDVVNSDPTTGAVIYRAQGVWSLASGQNMSGVYDNDFATFNTNFDVTYTLSDDTGRQLDRWTTTARTPG